jgi:hypothetical protein
MKTSLINRLIPTTVLVLALAATVTAQNAPPPGGSPSARGAGPRLVYFHIVYSDTRFFHALADWFANHATGGRGEEDSCAAPTAGFWIGQAVRIENGSFRMHPVWLSASLPGADRDCPVATWPAENEPITPGATFPMSGPIRIDIDASGTAGPDKSGDEKQIVGEIVAAVIRGDLPAYDWQTGKTIPPGGFLSWRAAADTVMREDADGRQSIIVQVRPIAAESIGRLRVTLRWSFDPAGGRLYTSVLSAELLAKKYAGDGWLIGLAPFARIRAR